MSIHSRIDGVYRDISDTYNMISGVNHEVLEIYNTIEGANREIFKSSNSIGDLPIGALVKSNNTKYNGAVIRFIIGHQVSGRTKLITEKVISLKCFDAKEPNNPNTSRKNYGSNRYGESNIDQWLNSASSPWYSARHTYDAPPNDANVWLSHNDYEAEPGFLSNFEANFQTAILDTVIRTAKPVSDGAGYEDISRRVYLLSGTEIGQRNENGIIEGTRWDYFDNISRCQVYPTEEAVNVSEYKATNISPTQYVAWWLRTPVSNNTHAAYHIFPDAGNLTNGYVYIGRMGICPALEIPSDTAVSSDTDSDGCYILQF